MWYEYVKQLDYDKHGKPSKPKAEDGSVLFKEGKMICGVHISKAIETLHELGVEKDIMVKFIDKCVVK